MKEETPTRKASDILSLIEQAHGEDPAPTSPEKIFEGDLLTLKKMDSLKLEISKNLQKNEASPSPQLENSLMTRGFSFEDKSHRSRINSNLQMHVQRMKALEEDKRHRKLLSDCGVGRAKIRTFKNVSHKGSLDKLSERIEMEYCGEEFIEEESFPILNFQNHEKLMTELDNIKHLDTKFLTKFYVKNLTPMAKTQSEQESMRKHPFMTCTAIALNNKRQLAIATQWDFIIIYNLKTKKHFYLKQKKQG